VSLPEALARTDPKAAREPGWHGVGPARARLRPAQGGATRRSAGRARPEGWRSYAAPQCGDPEAGARGAQPRAPGTARPCRGEDPREVHPWHGAGHPAMTTPAGPVPGLTAGPGARRPGLAPAASAAALVSTPARPQGHVRALGAGVGRRSTPARTRA
jgi:hypothetical protein